MRFVTALADFFRLQVEQLPVTVLFENPVEQFPETFPSLGVSLGILEHNGTGEVLSVGSLPAFLY